MFNITFISFFQSVLLFLFSSLPTYTILVASQHEPNITVADIFYFCVQIVLVFSEWISDGQQWRKMSWTANHNVQMLIDHRLSNRQI